MAKYQFSLKYLTAAVLVVGFFFGVVRGFYTVNSSQVGLVAGVGVVAGITLILGAVAVVWFAVLWLAVEAIERFRWRPWR